MKELVFKIADSIRVIATVSAYLQTLKSDKEYTLTIKEHKQKRSLSANNYFWTLCDKLAVKLNKSKTEIYRSYVKEIGGNSELVCCIDRAVPALCRAWERNGVGWIAEKEDSKLKGCTNIRLYFGSSTYDTAQMKRLINLIIQDCRENDIEYLTPAELEIMLGEWRGDET